MASARKKTDLQSRGDLSKLVELQNSGSGLPLYAVPGWGGSTYSLTHLASCFTNVRPVYGFINCRSLEKKRLPISVETIARDFGNTILSHKSGVSVNLLGYSAGGWYAFATAQYLTSRGFDVPFVGVIDSEILVRMNKRIFISSLPSLIKRLSHYSLTHLNQLWKIQSGRMQNLRRSSVILREYIQPYRRSNIRLDSRKEVRIPPYGNYYLELLKSYKPYAIPSDIHYFCTDRNFKRYGNIWGAYTTGSFFPHVILQTHTDILIEGKNMEISKIINACMN
jgi:thioesterase domain-containing protein